ncbi:hypothetical protein SAMD00019534_074710 [Acytostelium subglobosum LB1]|uniref:hypothetical protein n=1 Tax=Acytostelium subglobosum LB1 TaxID=1410327 RepID=UPI0006450F94|nr:hypothetical protein SAMD00019534_074710 [Acytostelium subglobosum LB1]GAM24296.1 hypothetical protein SAMD00019534_074710 [Acytostelium subglobosum LB1]|eukprot:XP_012752622.1 hypothetical protein SAMD00019534_074710 [Acytostelium subglobosum LB1]
MVLTNVNEYLAGGCGSDDELNTSDEDASASLSSSMSSPDMDAAVAIIDCQPQMFLNPHHFPTSIANSFVYIDPTQTQTPTQTQLHPLPIYHQYPYIMGSATASSLQQQLQRPVVAESMSYIPTTPTATPCFLTSQLEAHSSPMSSAISSSSPIQTYVQSPPPSSPREPVVVETTAAVSKKTAATPTASSKKRKHGTDSKSLDVSQTQTSRQAIPIPTLAIPTIPSVVPSTPRANSSISIVDNQILLQVTDFFHQLQSNRTLPLFVQMSDVQRTHYYDEVRAGIPKTSPSQAESHRITLRALYLILMDCVNHPFLLQNSNKQEQLTADQLLQCSGKLIVLSTIIETMHATLRSNTTNHSIKPQRLFVLSSSQSMLNLLETYFKLSSIKFTKPGNDQTATNEISKEVECKEETAATPLVILSTFLESSIYVPFTANDIVVDDQAAADDMVVSLPSANYDPRAICPTIILIAEDSVEEWAYLQDQESIEAKNKSTSTTPSGAKREGMFEMMKFCLLKLSQSRNGTPRVPCTPPTPHESYSSPLISSPSTSSSPLLMGASASPTPLPPLSLSNPGMLTLYSQIHKDQPSDYNPWKSNSRINLVPSSLSSPELGSSLDGSSKGAPEKKRRTSKRQKNLGERICFVCKKDEDKNGRTSIVQCRSCPVIYHRSCAQLSHTPRSWKCPRHSCCKCRKTPNEAGGSFFICQECPSSYCITCLPNDITILKNDVAAHHDHTVVSTPRQLQSSASSSTLSPRSVADGPSDDVPAVTTPNTKKPTKTPRPTVSILCGKCTPLAAAAAAAAAASTSKDSPVECPSLSCPELADV